MGFSGLTMEEGENIGPSGGLNGQSFYYNTVINKFLIFYDVDGNNTIYRWTTFNPTVNTGLSSGNPTASQQLTTSTNWRTDDLTSSQYTISGDSNIVVTASTKVLDAGGTDKMIRCTKNSALVNGFYSTCAYIDYTHEVTIGSTYADNDTIGIVLAAIKDDNGLYGPSGQTHTLQLHFKNTDPVNNSVKLRYNHNNSVQAFSGGSDTYNTLVWSGASPFLESATQNTNFNLCGNVRVKTIKTGDTISVYTTKSMGNTGGTQNRASVNVGDSNPYSLLFTVDLTDKTTWNAAPSYAIGNELNKFTGGTKFGYLTFSQPQTQFYDIIFSGSQQTNTDVIYTDSLADPDEYNISVFNEVDGCWDYIQEVTGYTGNLDTLTVSTGYTSCGTCP